MSKATLTKLRDNIKKNSLTNRNHNKVQANNNDWVFLMFRLSLCVQMMIINHTQVSHKYNYHGLKLNSVCFISLLGSNSHLVDVISSSLLQTEGSPVIRPYLPSVALLDWCSYSAMKGEGEAPLAAHPPPSSWLLHPVLQRGPMMVSPSRSTNPIPASTSAKQSTGVVCRAPAFIYWETCLHCSGKDDSLGRGLPACLSAS